MRDDRDCYRAMFACDLREEARRFGVTLEMAVALAERLWPSAAGTFHPRYNSKETTK